jgi:TetR/AcrR family transcriptional repressor of nem operon
MGRPQAFERDEMLDQAMQVFWDKGYEAASVQDLVDATGVNRGSIYHAFGNKAGLFDAVLERYLSASTVSRVVADAETADPRRAIEALIRDTVENGVSVNAHRGCLMARAAAENCSSQLMDKIVHNSALLEDALALLVERGQAGGEISQKWGARSLARFLGACIQGMSARAKMDPNRAALQAIADIALSALD